MSLGDGMDMDHHAEKALRLRAEAELLRRARDEHQHGDCQCGICTAYTRRIGQLERDAAWLEEQG